MCNYCIAVIDFQPKGSFISRSRDLPAPDSDSTDSLLVWKWWKWSVFLRLLSEAHFLPVPVAAVTSGWHFNADILFSLWLLLFTLSLDINISDKHVTFNCIVAAKIWTAWDSLQLNNKLVAKSRRERLCNNLYQLNNNVAGLFFLFFALG